MPGPWDDLMKSLIRAKPQDIAAFVLPGTRVKERLSEELKRTVYADVLLMAEREEQPLLIHIEFQTKADPRMGERMLEYNIRASREHDYLPVYSCVIYIRKDTAVASSPLVLALPGGEETCRFTYGELELGKLSAEQLLQTGRLGLLPLVLLTKDGTQPEAVDTMISRLGTAKESELLALSYILGGLVFPEGTRKEWFKRRFHMFEEMLQDNWAIRELMEKGLEKGMKKGLEQGLEKGLEQGELRGTREIILDMVQARFPTLEALTKEQVETIRDTTLLRRLAVKISTVQTTEEATVAILAAGEETKQ